MNIEIANRLVQLSKANHLSQEELAARLGISRQAVSKWERAEASPDTDNLIMLARLYRVSLDELLRIEDIPTPAEDVSLTEEASGGAPAVIPQDEWPDGNPDGRPDEPPLLAVIPGHEIQAWDSGNRENRWNQFPYPVLVTLIFLLLGFIGDWWHPAWLLFLTIPVYYIIGDSIRNKRKLLEGVYPICMVILFLLLGFTGGWWHPGWLVFLTIPLYYSVMDIVLHKRSWKNFVYPVFTAIVFLLLGFIGGWWHPGWLIFLTIPLYYALFASEGKQEKR